MITDEIKGVKITGKGVIKSIYYMSSFNSAIQFSNGFCINGQINFETELKI